MSEEGEQDSSGGSVLKKYGPLALIVLLAQVVLAWAVLTFVIKGNLPGKEQPQSEEKLFDDRPAASTSNRGGAKAARVALPYIYAPTKLSDMTANPAGTNAQRFVMFSVQLGLVAANTKESDPEKRDITADLAAHPDVLAKLDGYVALMKSIIVQVVRQKTVPELEGENLLATADEIRDRLNTEILNEAFKLEDDKGGFMGFGGEKGNKITVQVQDVIFTDIIMQ